MQNRKLITVDTSTNALPDSTTVTPNSMIFKVLEDNPKYSYLPSGTTLSVIYGDAWNPRPTTRPDVFVHWIGGSEAPTDMIQGDLWFKAKNAPEVSDITPPSTPAGLTSSNISVTGFTINWDASTDASGIGGYEVYIGGVLKAATATTSYTVNGLNSDTQYSVTVRSSDTVGNYSTMSEPLTVKTLAPVLGEFHSIYGTDDPPATLSYHNDANPSIITSTGFYTTGDSVGWSCVGARQFIPVGSEAIGKTITMGLYRGGQPVDDSFGPDLSWDTLRSATTTAVAGWNEVIWDSPYTLETGLPAVYVSTTFGTNEYLVGSLQPKDSSIPSPTSGNRLHMAESSPDVVRSAYKIMGYDTKRSTDSFWYGQDILVAESVN